MPEISTNLEAPRPGTANLALPITSARPDIPQVIAKPPEESKWETIKKLFQVNPQNAIDASGNLHPDHVTIDELQSQVKSNLENCEREFGLKLPSWFMKLAKHSCGYMQNVHSSRWLALGNEAAEAFRDHVKEIVPWLEKPFYYGAWGLTIFYTVMRNLMVSVRGGGVACVKNTIHDLFAEAVVPPLIVRYTNNIQQNISKWIFGKKPNHLIGQIIHWTRPFTSMAVGNKIMRFLDRGMVNIIPLIFKQLPMSWSQGLNKLFRDIGYRVGATFFKDPAPKPIPQYILNMEAV